MAVKSAAATEALGRIFSEVQSGRLPVGKAVGAIARLQAESGGFNFLRVALRRCVDLFLLTPLPSTPDTDRPLRLLVESATIGPTSESVSLPSSRRSAAAVHWANDDWAQFLLRYLLALSSAGEKAVRLRVAQVTAQLLEATSQPSVQQQEFFGDLEDDLLAQVLLKMQERTRDKSAAVRVWALRALRRLQRPSDPSDVVHGHYLRMMANDPSDSVRLAAVSAVATNTGISARLATAGNELEIDSTGNPSVAPTTNAAVIALVERCRDASQAVRDMARKVLGRVPFGELASNVRIALVNVAASDEELGELLCKAWLPSVGGDLLAILAGMCVAANEQLVERVVRIVLGCVSPPLRMSCKVTLASTGELTTVFTVSCLQSSTTHEALTDELSLLWRIYVAFFNDPMSDALDDVIPELSLVTEMARQATTRPFICRQLLLFIRTMDLFDEVGRRSLDSLLQSLVPAMSDVPGVVEVAVDNLHRLHPEEGEWTRLIVQLLADLRDPIDADAESQCQLAPSSAAEEQQQLAPDREASIWRGALNVLCRFLETTKNNLRDPLVAGVLVSLILPTVTHKEPSVRIGGIRALGLYCLLGKSAAKEYLFLFLKVLEHDIPEIKRVALQVLLDVVLAHGTAALGITDTLSLDLMSRAHWSDDEAQERALIAIVSCLSDSDLRSTAAEGLAKLFFVGTLACPEVFARLLVLRFDPTVSNDLRLGICLSTFFPAYVFSRRFHDKHQLVAERAFLPAIQWAQSCNISRCRLQQSITEIPVVELACFMQKLTGPPPPSLVAKLCGHDSSCHSRMAMAMLAHMTAHPRQIAHLVDLLTGFDLRECSQETLDQIAQAVAPLLSRKEVQPAHKKKLSTFQDSFLGKAREKPKKTKKSKRDREEEEEEEGEEGSQKEDVPSKRQKVVEPEKPTAAASLTIGDAEETTAVESDKPSAVVVVFAGFKGGNEHVQALAEKVQELDGTVRGEDDSLDSSITHLVRPEGAVTTKTLVAALLHYWLVSPAWVDACYEAGHFVDESTYGRRFLPDQGPLLGKKVALLEAYKHEPRFDWPLHQTLVETAGQGAIIDESKKATADFLLVPREMPREERVALEAQHKGMRVLDRIEFFRMLAL